MPNLGGVQFPVPPDHAGWVTDRWEAFQRMQLDDLVELRRRQYQQANPYQRFPVDMIGAGGGNVGAYGIGNLMAQPPRRAQLSPRPMPPDPSGTWVKKTPEVAYFLDKIPAAEVLINKEGPALVSFFLSAKANGLSLREQCDAIGFPWILRNEKAGDVSMEVVHLGNMIEPKKFGQFRKGVKDLRVCAKHLMNLYQVGYSMSLIEWVFKNFQEIVEWAGTDVEDLMDYWSTLKDVDLKLPPSAMLRRNEEWHEEMWQKAGRREAMEMERVFGVIRVPEELERLREFSFHGLKFKMLTSALDFVKEGSTMRHCIRQHYGSVIDGFAVVFSVTDEQGKRVATAKYVVKKGGSLVLQQAKGFANAALATPLSEILRQMPGIFTQQGSRKPENLVKIVDDQKVKGD